MRPVLLLIRSVRPSLLRPSQNSEVLRSCHTMALYTGSPVSASHTIVVSRWFVMPIAAMLRPLMSMDVMASAITDACDDHISIGLCSTQPGFGNICVNSFCDTAFVWPCSSKTIALELLVPWSRARMYFSMIMWLLVDSFADQGSGGHGYHLHCAVVSGLFSA